MKVVLAPNALKGSLTATEAAEAMARGVRRACGDADIVQVPASDGGDGLIDVLVHALGGELRTVMITGPRGDPVEGSFGYIPNRDLAIIEMALASGLQLLPKDKRNPIETTTYGTGRRNLPIWQPLLRPIVKWMYAICRAPVRPYPLYCHSRQCG